MYSPNIYQSTQSHILEDLNMHQHCCHKLESRTGFHFLKLSAQILQNSQMPLNSTHLKNNHEESSMPRIHNPEVNCELHCYLAFSAQCM